MRLSNFKKMRMSIVDKILHYCNHTTNGRYGIINITSREREITERTRAPAPIITRTLTRRLNAPPRHHQSNMLRVELVALSSFIQLYIHISWYSFLCKMEECEVVTIYYYTDSFVKILLTYMQNICK